MAQYGYKDIAIRFAKDGPGGDYGQVEVFRDAVTGEPRCRVGQTKDGQGQQTELDFEILNMIVTAARLLIPGWRIDR